MKNIRNLALVFIAIIALCSSMMLTAFAADNHLEYTADASADVVYSATEETAVGQTFTVDISVPVNKGFLYSKIVVTYDTYYLSYVGNSHEQSAFDGLTITDNGNGKITIIVGSFSSLNEKYQDVGKLTTLTFKVKDEVSDKLTTVAVTANCKNTITLDGQPAPSIYEGKADIQIINKLTHAHTVVVDEAVTETCTTEGKTEGKHCSVCKEVIVAQETIPAKGHTAVVDNGVDATCLTAGKTEGSHCSVCNEIIVAQEDIPAKGHTEIDVEAVKATCTEDGFTAGKQCSVCKEYTVAVTTIPKTGHNYGAWEVKVPATTTSEGKQERVCANCGDVEEEVLPKLEETPTEPTEPVDPTEPTTPTTPTDPTVPTEPTDPTEPTTPTEPTDPIEPTTPTKPVEPTEPSESTKPSLPSDPTQPEDDPFAPTEPGNKKLSTSMTIAIVIASIVLVAGIGVVIYVATRKKY